MLCVTFLYPARGPSPTEEILAKRRFWHSRVVMTGCSILRGRRGIAMAGEYRLEKCLEHELERQLADAHVRIREMIREIDQRDELIAELQRRVQELEQAGNSQP